MQQITHIRMNYQIPVHMQEQLNLLEKGAKQDPNSDVLLAIKRFKRQLENELKYNQTDYHAFIKKHKSLNIPFVPLVYEIKLDFAKKAQLEYQDLTNPNFNHHLYSTKELIQAAVNIFQMIGFGDDNIEKLIQKISYNYNILSYHNFTHAFALFQLLFCCYETSELKAFVTKDDIFGALIASIAHDMNHKGVNNLYKIKKAKNLGKVICEQAVLESMHAATLINIFNQFSELDVVQNNLELRRMIVTSILATDMGQHFNLTKAFSERVEATNSRDETQLQKFRKFNKDSFEDRKFILNIMVHACDISNPCLEWDIYMKWSFLLSQEFQDQTVKEAKNGLEVMGMFVYKDKTTFLNGQQFFLTTFVQPLWDSISNLYPQLIHLPDEIKKNLEIIKNEKAKL